MLPIEQWAAGGSSHVWLFGDAGGRFLQLRVSELRPLTSGGLLFTPTSYIAAFYDTYTRSKAFGAGGNMERFQYPLKPDRI